MSNLDALIQDLVIANRILAREEVVDAYGHVSVRHPNNPYRFLIARSRQAKGRVLGPRNHAESGEYPSHISEAARDGLPRRSAPGLGSRLQSRSSSVRRAPECAADQPPGCWN